MQAPPRRYATGYTTAHPPAADLQLQIAPNQPDHTQTLAINQTHQRKGTQRPVDTRKLGESGQGSLPERTQDQEEPEALSLLAAVCIHAGCTGLHLEHLSPGQLHFAAAFGRRRHVKLMGRRGDRRSPVQGRRQRLSVAAGVGVVRVVVELQQGERGHAGEARVERVEGPRLRAQHEQAVHGTHEVRVALGGQQLKPDARENRGIDQHHKPAGSPR